MTAERDTIHVRTDSELAEVLVGATESREPFFVDIGETVFEIHVHATVSSERFKRYKPYSNSDIAGLGNSGTTGSIGDHKDEYIADADDHKKR